MPLLLVASDYPNIVVIVVSVAILELEPLTEVPCKSSTPPVQWHMIFKPPAKCGLAVKPALAPIPHLPYCNEVVVDERTLYSTTNNSVSSWDIVAQYV